MCEIGKYSREKGAEKKRVELLQLVKVADFYKGTLSDPEPGCFFHYWWLLVLLICHLFLTFHMGISDS